MSPSLRRIFGIAVPLLISAIGIGLWYRFGFEPLDRIERPLAEALNGLTGRAAWFDSTVVFLNHWWGEALCVLVIFAAFCLTARWVVGRAIDWRRVAAYSGFIFAFWVVANGIGDFILEEYMPRASPTYAINGELVDLEEVRDVDVKTSSWTSFPSNHGSVFFTVFFFALLRWGRKAWVIFPICVVLSLPRCFTGAHWVSDSLIGSVLVTWSVAAIAVYTPLFRITLAAEEFACRLLHFFETDRDRAMRADGERGI